MEENKENEEYENFESEFIMENFYQLSALHMKEKIYYQNNYWTY